jgi:ABC-type uncharacterized transport system substrate-binding protein
MPVSGLAEANEAVGSMRHSRIGRWALGLLCLVVYGCAAFAPSPAQAHPHVWVTMTTELLYDANGAVTGLRQAWSFDDMFSAFATTGIPAKTKGHFTDEELQPIADVNVTSLKDFEYFTYATVDGKRDRDAFTDPIDYSASFDPKTTVLTLHFTLPFNKPVKAKLLKIEIYDPTFFIDFAYASKDAVKLVGAPARCTVAAEKPPDPNFVTSQQLNKGFIPSELYVGMGDSFANKITVQCP